MKTTASKKSAHELLDKRTLARITKARGQKKSTAKNTIKALVKKVEGLNRTVERLEERLSARVDEVDMSVTRLAERVAETTTRVVAAPVQQGRKYEPAAPVQTGQQMNEPADNRLSHAGPIISNPAQMAFPPMALLPRVLHNHNHHDNQDIEIRVEDPEDNPHLDAGILRRYLGPLLAPPHGDPRLRRHVVAALNTVDPDSWYFDSDETIAEKCAGELDSIIWPGPGAREFVPYWHWVVVVGQLRVLFRLAGYLRHDHDGDDMWMGDSPFVLDPEDFED